MLYLRIDSVFQGEIFRDLTTGLIKFVVREVPGYSCEQRWVHSHTSAHGLVRLGPGMLLYRHGLPDLREMPQVDLGDRDRVFLALRHLGHHLAPGVHHACVPVRLTRRPRGLGAVRLGAVGRRARLRAARAPARRWVRASLRGGNHVTLRLDRARAQQRRPMCDARAGRKGGGDEERLGARRAQGGVQRGEAQVVADREAESAGRGVGAKCKVTARCSEVALKHHRGDIKKKQDISGVRAGTIQLLGVRYHVYNSAYVVRFASCDCDCGGRTSRSVA